MTFEQFINWSRLRCVHCSDMGVMSWAFKWKKMNLNGKSFSAVMRWFVTSLITHTREKAKASSAWERRFEWLTKYRYDGFLKLPNRRWAWCPSQNNVISFCCFFGARRSRLTLEDLPAFLLHILRCSFFFLGGKHEENFNCKLSFSWCFG